MSDLQLEKAARYARHEMQRLCQRVVTVLQAREWLLQLVDFA